MNRKYSFVLACAIALMTGCAANKNNKHASIASQNSTIEASTEAASEPAAATPAPAVEGDCLAGEWQLAMPRRQPGEAKITFTDPTHVTIDAGENLSGKYVVHGSYLLILTHDERMQTLAWKINSPDSLTVVRSPEAGTGGVDYTGVTLVRAPEMTETQTAETGSDEWQNGQSRDSETQSFESETALMKSSSEGAQAQGDTFEDAGAQSDVSGGAQTDLGEEKTDISYEE